MVCEEYWQWNTKKKHYDVDGDIVACGCVQTAPHQLCFMNDTDKV